MLQRFAFINHFMLSEELTTIVQILKYRKLSSNYIYLFKMEVPASFESFVHTCQTTWRHISENHNLNILRCDKVKSQIYIWLQVTVIKITQEGSI
jgi:hypothetical protein